ncbi:hypothetical protein VFPBJ_03109 [Purpureocillium lilacinum]|uniref:Uncharacterized protein n=1 Tax=Purpureocillium lilacinum TaxID=33203 RepID=A0A179H489_PURLI|nr:hypothetical protein VFPBJ_03109 [Purpureocillium lilacinum]
MLGIGMFLAGLHGGGGRASLVADPIRNAPQHRCVPRPHCRDVGAVRSAAFAPCKGDSCASYSSRVPSRSLARNWNSTASLGLVTLGTLRDKAEEHALWHTSRASARRYATRPTRGFVAARARVNEQILSPRPVSIAAGVSDVQKSTCTLLMRPTQQ